MARSQGGANGSFSGKVGSIIGYRLRGKDVIRGLPKISKKKPSIKQLAHRKKFKLIQEWRSFLTPFFATTFKNHTTERSAQNAAHRCNSDLVVGEYPDYKIDYSRIVISAGDLPGLKDLAMMVNNNRLQVTWNKTLENGAKHSDLTAILICYNESLFFDCSTAVSTRSTGEFTFQLNYPLQTTFADVYVTVIADDRTRAANSTYLGRINLG